MNGAEVLAEALLKSADTFYTVTGYPVTELAELLHAEMTVNEKTAMEYALGDSLSKKRSVVILKNVGLNNCADPLINATTQGLISGVLLIAGDDVDVISSQNAQDSRYYGEIAQVPLFDPDRETIGISPEIALQASETFSRVSVIRVTSHLLENRADRRTAPRKDGTGHLADNDLTMPGRADHADNITNGMFEWSHKSPVPLAYPPGDNYNEKMDEGSRRPYYREHRQVLPPPRHTRPETMTERGFARTLCRGCPFLSVLAIMKEKGQQAVCDIGCSLLAKNPPYDIGIASYGLGSSIGVAAKSTGIALCGDYALLHSGINALIDVYEKKIPMICIILKNNRMGMTGGQKTPDIMDYISWTRPVLIRADDHEAISKALVIENRPKTVVIEGTCPEGALYEKVEC